MKKKLIIIGLLLVIVVAAGYLVSRKGNAVASRYQFVEVQRGDIRSTISSTGTVSAVETVEVGTQVSGIISSIFVDYNDTVRKGQLLARLDTDLLEVALREAEASLTSAQAKYDQAAWDLKQRRQLFEKGFSTESDYTLAQTNAATALATLQSTQASLERARINLQHAEISSPIDGIVIERNVDEGQTVAASLSTPTLFVIAKDLSSMQIEAYVDESDIGQVKEGQKVEFTVPAYPDQTLEGVVRQVRLQPTTVSNVVNYIVVVDAKNKGSLLLPGMTATLDFVVQEVEDVLLVSNAAFRFQPTEEVLSQLREKRQPQLRQLPDSLRQRLGAPAAEGQSQFEGGHRLGALPTSNPTSNRAMLWYLDEHGKLAVTPITTGTTDGLVTEIVMAPGVEEGFRAISAVSGGTKAGSNASSSTRSPGPPMGPRLF